MRQAKIEKAERFRGFGMYFKNGSKKLQSLNIPTIGIGSSNLCDGQILVTDDMLGMSGFYPKFVKKYTLRKNYRLSCKKIYEEVKSRKFQK